MRASSPNGCNKRASRILAGRFGAFGGQFVTPLLLPVLRRLDSAFSSALSEPGFAAELNDRLRSFAARPTPLQFATCGTQRLSGAKLYWKREDLSAIGGSAANAALGQCLLARRIGFRHVVAEMAPGTHGIAVAAAARELNLRCTIFVAGSDIARPGAFASVAAGHEVDVRVVRGSEGRLDDAMSAAMRFWIANARDVSYVAGAPVGPHPYPSMVRWFQAVIGDETRNQILAMERQLPAAVVVAAGGGSTAVGLFSAFINDASVRLIAVEGGGTSNRPGEHAGKLRFGRDGVLHGARSLLLQDADGQVLRASSAATGFRYPAAAPELAWHSQRGRVESWLIRDHQAHDALRWVRQCDDLEPSLEASHAVAAAIQLAPLLARDASVVVAISSHDNCRRDASRRADDDKAAVVDP